MIEEEIHPWKWFAPPNSKTLIVGTFPPTKKNWSYDFFYPNKLNLFWKVIARIAKVELQYFIGDKAVAERKQLLTSLNLAITDMGYKIARQYNSSLDENLKVVVHMDIFQILDENPGIDKIIFTSSSGPSSAARWFVEYLQKANIIHKFPKGARPIKSQFIYKNKPIDLVILYSPSPRAANRVSFENLVALYENEIKREIM